ncbi:MAG: hypothetical protein JSU82_17385, partial [Rhodospirillales bacterium]
IAAAAIAAAAIAAAAIAAAAIAAAAIAAAAIAAAIASASIAAAAAGAFAATFAAAFATTFAAAAASAITAAASALIILGIGRRCGQVRQCTAIVNRNRCGPDEGECQQPERTRGGRYKCAPARQSVHPVPGWIHKELHSLSFQRRLS